MNMTQKANSFLYAQSKDFTKGLKARSETYKPTRKEALKISEMEAERIAKEFKEKVRCELDKEYKKKVERKKDKTIKQPDPKAVPILIKIGFYLMLIYFAFKPIL